jgi:DNA-binding transcriptional ArsR family regulator
LTPAVTRFQDITDPALAKALAHPLRTRILAALEDRTASPSDLAEELDAPLGVVSYHVRRLATLGLVKLVKRVPRRGAVEHYYRATGRPRITSETWGQTPSIVKNATIQAAVDQVGYYVGAAASGGGFDAPESHLSRSRLKVDEKGWEALARELEATLERVRKIELASEQRLTKANHDGEQEANLVLMLFNSPPEAPKTDAPKRRAGGRRAGAGRGSRSAP